MSDLFPLKDTPLAYDTTTGEHRQLGELIINPATQTQRVESFAERDEEWEEFCNAAAKIPGMVEVQKRCEKRVKEYLKDN